MRRHLAPLLFAGCLASLVSCANDDKPAVAAAAKPPAPATREASAVAVTPASSAPVRNAGTKERTTASSQVPAGWRACTNEVEDYTVAYPGGWHTHALEPNQECAFFDPQTFRIPKDSEFPVTALMAHYLGPDESFDNALHSLTDPMYQRTLSRRETVVVGRPAVRLETESTGEGPFDRGTRAYGYVVNVGGRAFYGWTSSTDERAYAANKRTVDKAVRTLRFR